MAVETAEKLYTAEEYAALPDTGAPRDLVRGKVVEMSWPGGRHGTIATRAMFTLTVWANEHGGRVLSDTGFLLERRPDTVRAPDVAYLPAEHAETADSRQHVPVAPRVVIEVNSPNDAAGVVIDKARWWLAHGVKQVWIADDTSRTVTVYHPDGAARVYGESDTLTADDVLPGFALPLSDLFR